MEPLVEPLHELIGDVFPSLWCQMDHGERNLLSSAGEALMAQRSHDARSPTHAVESLLRSPAAREKQEGVAARERGSKWAPRECREEVWGVSVW